MNSCWSTAKLKIYLCSMTRFFYHLETLNQQRYVEELSGMMLGRENEVQLLLNYALGNTNGFKLGGMTFTNYMYFD